MTAAMSSLDELLTDLAWDDLDEADAKMDGWLLVGKGAKLSLVVAPGAFNGDVSVALHHIITQAAEDSLVHQKAMMRMFVNNPRLFARAVMLMYGKDFLPETVRDRIPV